MYKIGVDVVGTDFSVGEHHLQVVDTCRCGEFEHILTMHHEREVGRAFEVVWAPLQVMHLIETIPSVGAGETCGEDIVAWCKHRRSCTGSEEHSTCTVTPAKHVGRGLSADHEDVLHSTYLIICFGDVAGIDEAHTRTVKVNTRAFCPDLLFYDTTQCRCHIFIDHIGTDDKIEIFGIQISVSQSFLGCIDSKIEYILRREYTAFLDAGTRRNPFVRCVENLSEHLVGDHFLWKRTAYS